MEATAELASVKSETQAELTRARSENSRLQYINHALFQRLSESNEKLLVRKQRLVVKNAYTSLQRYCPCHLLKLPHEILLIVLRYTLPPSWLLTGEISLPPFAQSIWSADIRMKLSIIGVCKLWHQIGLELLYERVTLRRIGQMPAFVHALELRQDLGAFVRSVAISCFVPHGYAGLHNREAKKIMRLCPNLARFAFNPPLLMPNSPCSLPAFSSSITTLEYNSNVDYSLIILPSLVHLFKTLETLAFTPPSLYDATHPTLTFGHLGSLRLHLTTGSVVPSKWVMPHLRSVWLHAGSFYEARKQLEAEAFLHSHGRTVTCLRLSNIEIEIGASIQGMLDQCPMLEHIAVGASVLTAGPLTHRAISSVDVFCFPGHRGADITFSSLKEGFPELSTFRTLDISMQFLWDIPTRTIPADWVLMRGADASRGNEDQNSDSDECHESAWISAILSTNPDSDDDEDDDYVFDEAADDGGSVDTGSTSSSDGESCTTDHDEGPYVQVKEEFYLGEKRKIGRQEALEIFRGS